ncbi:MAG: hypothetical protein Q8934_18815 [Bacillota bacterium]|nr:hypothetical protein [Bacillota bacterium]
MSIAVVMPTNLVKVLLFKAISIYWMVAVDGKGQALCSDPS